jgi:HSP20 family protein
MKLTRYDPWKELQWTRNDLSRLFGDRFLSDQGDGDHSNVVTSSWTPEVDIKEEDERFVIRADVPGVAPEEIELTMDNGVLTIRGERKEEHKDEGEGYCRVERMQGTFYRRFSLPDTAQADGITAKGDNGVLEVVIPKQPKAQPKRIKVKH